MQNTAKIPQKVDHSTTDNNIVAETVVVDSVAFVSFQQICQNPLTTEGAIVLIKCLTKSTISQITDLHMIVSYTVWMSLISGAMFI